MGSRNLQALTKPDYKNYTPRCVYQGYVDVRKNVKKEERYMFRISRNRLPNSLRWLRRALTVILIVSNFAKVMLTDAAPAQAEDTQPSFPIRAAFYYPRFPEAWKQQSFNPFTNYNPSLGFYDGGSRR
jgi:hypothetical protein